MVCGSDTASVTKKKGFGRLVGGWDCSRAVRRMTYEWSESRPIPSDGFRGPVEPVNLHRRLPKAHQNDKKGLCTPSRKPYPIPFPGLAGLVLPFLALAAACPALARCDATPGKKHFRPCSPPTRTVGKDGIFHATMEEFFFLLFSRLMSSAVTWYGEKFSSRRCGCHMRQG